MRVGHAEHDQHCAPKWLDNHYPLRTVRAFWPTDEQVETFEEIARAHAFIQRDRPLWTSGALGMFFIDHPQLRVIFEMDDIVSDEGPHTIVLSDADRHWGFRKEYPELERRLMQSVDQGRYELDPSYTRLAIFRRRSSDSD